MSAISLATYRDSRAAELFFPLAYEEESRLFVMADNTLGFGFICRPMVAADDRTFERLNVLLKDNWPAGTFLQFALYASENIEPILGRMRDSRAGQQDKLMQDAVEARAKFLTDGVSRPVERRSGLRCRDFQLYVTIKMPMGDAMPTDAEMGRAVERRISTEKSLENIGFGCRPMTNESYLDVMGAILNHGRNASWRRSERGAGEADKLLRDQILDYDTDIRVLPNGIMLGEVAHVRTLSVKRLPAITHFGAASSFVGDSFEGIRGIRGPFLLTCSVFFPDPQKTRTALASKRQVVTYQAYGPMLKWMPPLAQRKLDFDALFERMEDGDRVVKVNLTLNLFAYSAEEATGAVSTTTSYWSELGYQLLQDRFISLPLFLNSLPFNSEQAAIKDLFRSKTMSSKHACMLLPIFADWAGTGTPIINLISRNGQVMSLDIFDSASNYNTCIAAQSGSGKSFLSNEIISSYLSIEGQVWVIDVGRSYEKLCNLLGGDFLYFGKDSEICLNPFGIINDYEDEADMLVGLIIAMAAPREGVNEFQEQHIKMVLRRLWEDKGRNMIVDDVAAELAKAEDQRVQDLAVQLYSFTTQGEYGRFFNGQNNVDFKNRFTVLELEELKGRKHLQQVVLLQLLLQISTEMYLGDRNRRKLVIIDEAWELLGHGDVAKFIEAGYRKFRKYGGAAITITQGVSDLYSTKTGEAIVQNSANMLLLGQKPEAIESLKTAKRLPLTDGGYNLLKTVRTEPGAYSEIFWISDYGVGIGRLIVDSRSQLMYSTKAEDVSAINYYIRSGLPVAEAVVKVLEDRRGNARLAAE